MLISKLKNILKSFFLILCVIVINACSTVESTFDSTIESIGNAGEYIYDSVAFWEDEEPEQQQAIIVEEAIEVPEFAIPNNVVANQQLSEQQLQQNYQYFSGPPIYRSARQYFSVTPNGTPMPVPPPPPFPQYSIDQNIELPYSYGANYNYLNKNYSNRNNNYQMKDTTPYSNQAPMMTEEQEMELFGIQNNCIRVVKDFVSGGYECDDFD